MCGIFGYVGKRKAVDIVLKGLKYLEYRGYDSSGIAGIDNDQLISFKEVGKIHALEALMEEQSLAFTGGAIAHTRWATHGKPSRLNAHPHFDQGKALALVHNGIIENHFELKSFLEEKGITTLSETDTELAAQLLGLHLQTHPAVEAIKATLPMLKGSYAFAMMHQNTPNQMIAIAQESPLVIGIGDGEAFLSSDANAFLEYTKDAIYLSNGEIAIITPEKVEIYNERLEKVTKDRKQLSTHFSETSKGQYEHYTLKEIFEQPQAIRNALHGRTNLEFGTASFEDVDSSALSGIERILILGCGTSYHAGCIGANMVEDLTQIPSQVEIASEFRYKNPIILPGTLVIAISQSGETADTIAAVREVKAKGAKVLAICNVSESTLMREADETILLRAGPEIGVCSTKAFTTQVSVLALLALLLGRTHHLSKKDGQAFIHSLAALPNQVQMVLNHAVSIQAIAKKYSRFQNFFFLGRRYMFPSSLEGALKLKEISYINANGYPAGEMKHGPIALIDETCPTVALCANSLTFEKLLSNLMEVKARSGPVIAIAEEGQKGLEKIAEDIFWVPKSTDLLAPILTTIATQLLAYYIAKERGAEIDQPRNLAKSVTVE